MSGKKRKKSDSSKPSIRRLSRRLNDLQADGSPVRLSRRLNDLNTDGTPISRRTRANVSPTKRSSAKRSIAVSIEKSAREQSKSKKKRAKISSYSSCYRDKKISDHLVCLSHSESTSQNSNSVKLAHLESCSQNSNSVIHSHTDPSSQNNNSLNMSQSESILTNSNPVSGVEDLIDEFMTSQESECLIVPGKKCNDRICYCDQQVLPLNCDNCDHISGIACESHQTISCTKNGCKKMFHMGCLSNYLSIDAGADDFDFESFICIPCYFKKNDSTPWNELVYNSQKLKRVGLHPSDNIRSVKKLLSTLFNVCNVPLNVIDDIRNNDPKAHPAICNISNDSVEKHAMCSRRFEISMLMFSLEQCSCCGRTQPYHQDYQYPKDAPFERKHFILKYHKAWECNCDDYCNGSQFYSHKRRSSLCKYRETHNGLNPWEYLGFDKNEHNASLCNTCHEEIKSNQAVDLQFARSLSARNGYGPIYKYPDVRLNEDINVSNGRRLQDLLLSLTCAEEAAIRQITPLVSLMRLSTGSISMKGNTSCVWQDSKLNLVLPNLPNECKFIIIKRKGKHQENRNIISTKFKRERIEEALQLLSLTVEGVWKETPSFPIEISRERLNAWPESGDLIDILSDECTIVDDSEECNDNDINPTNVTLNTDFGDAGPAPLQNNVIGDEEFEGILNIGETANSGNVDLATIALRAKINNIRNKNDIDVNVSNAVFQQEDIFNLGDFVNMNSTPFAWARAFPSLFIPVYKSINGTYRWSIFGDITSFSTIRDKSVKKKQWYEYLMWRSDGRPASHPVFPLVLYNHKVRDSLHRQGRFVLNSCDIDVNLTLQEIKDAQHGEEIDNVVKNLERKLHIYSSNIPCTPAYWKSTKFEFKATTLFNSYINNSDIRLFHTGSLAEYHEYFLRLILYKYDAALTYNDMNNELNILNCDKCFHSAVQKYKNIVTHYMGSKFEIWTSYVMRPIFGIEGGMATHEFAKSRGALHYHSMFPTSKEVDLEISSVLSELSKSILGLYNATNDFIKEHYDVEKHGNEYPTCPSLDFSTDGFLKKKSFCETFEEGKEFFSMMLESLVELKMISGKAIGELLSHEYGFNAMHEGICPDDWVKPGGLSTDSYRSTSEKMLSSEDILNRRELSFPKISRERFICERTINMTNQCRTHKCSNYCLVEKIVLMRYDPIVNHNVDDKDRYVLANGVEMYKHRIKECRMKFGRALNFDHSGENNITRGIPPIDIPHLMFDKNQQPRYMACRNHPRVVQAPYCFHYFGANNDTQYLLINSKGNECFEELGKKEYDNLFKSLLCFGMGGLEQHNGVHIIEHYITGYSCKGGEMSSNWQSNLRAITKEYCSRDDNKSKNLKSLVAKHLNEIAGSMTVSRDQASYLLGGGIMKRNSFGTPLKCSVHDVSLESLGEVDDKSFQWKNVERRYMDREERHINLNLYIYCVEHWSKNKITIPQFFGFHDVPKWPLNETYSKWNLVFFKPWSLSHDELRHDDGTFASCLNIFMYDSLFPSRKRAEILRAKLRVVGVDENEGADMQDGHIPEDDNIVMDDVFEDLIDSTISQNDSIGSNENTGLSDYFFTMLPDRVDANIDWSNIYNNIYINWLSKFAKAYYTSNHESVLRQVVGNNETILLFDETMYLPNNCIGDSQTFLIYHHLYFQYCMNEYKHNRSYVLPKQQFIFVEGKPGTGKTFIVKTLRNINRIIHKSNLVDIASAPTGCASALIGGSTHFRICKIPVGKKFYESPSNLKISSALEMKSLKKSMTSVIVRIMDEHSQCGRPFWAWLKNRHENLRRPQLINDDENNVLIDESLNFPLEQVVYERPWGGIPFIYSFGDCCQLPPVCMKSLYDNNIGKPNSADHFGQLAFNELLDSDHLDTTDTIVVKMDQVLRQDDPTFLKLLNNIRFGFIDDSDVELLLSRCFDRLCPEEQATFNNAIHLVPVWSMSDKIIFDYLLSFTTPIVKIRSIYNSIRSNGENHCISECSYPSRIAICEGAVVMLLKNFIVELNLMNGSIGVVKKIVFDSPNGPYSGVNKHPSYVIVEFKNVSIPEEKKAFPNYPANWVPIPVVTEHCEKRCCSITTIPLRVCVALTIHKSQGMTIGPGENFEKVIVYLPDKGLGQKSVAGLELVAISRATSIEHLAIGNPSSSLFIKDLKSIGKNKTNENIKKFHHFLDERAENSQCQVKEAITNLDDAVHDSANKTFNGGCNFLLSWFNSLR